MVIKANLFGMQITEVPTTLSKDGRSRLPHLLPWRDGWRHLRFMLLFSPLWLFIIPGLITSFLSFIVYIVLLNGSIHIGNVSFDVHTLFFAGTGLVLGYLAISLGVVTWMFGIREGLLQDKFIFEKLHTSPVLELGGGAGILLILSGFSSGGYALLEWSNTGFGALQSGELLRQVSLSTVLMLMGGITLMVSLIIGFLALPTRSERS
jgi:hypothetical protein